MHYYKLHYQDISTPILQSIDATFGIAWNSSDQSRIRTLIIDTLNNYIAFESAHQVFPFENFVNNVLTNLRVSVHTLSTPVIVILKSSLEDFVEAQSTEFDVVGLISDDDYASI